jgi:hypothetical protein
LRVAVALLAVVSALVLAAPAGGKVWFQDKRWFRVTRSR